jgi:23S rRNA pseudouridine2605 synthase
MPRPKRNERPGSNRRNTSGRPQSSSSSNRSSRPARFPRKGGPGGEEEKREPGQGRPFKAGARTGARPDRGRPDRKGDTPFNKGKRPAGASFGGPRRKEEGERSYSPKRKFGAGAERKSFVENRLNKQRKDDQPTKAERPKTSTELVRLNKFISNSGVCSRREADELIKMGLVTVNGQTITEMGFKVKPTDEVRYEGKRLKAEKPVYILMNKPKGYITTTDDPQERNTVMHLIANACKERVYPVGRLDRNTTGLLLLTNDGDLADKLTHPSYNVKKIYKVELDRPMTKADFQKLAEGVHLEEGKAVPDDLAIVSDDNKTVGIELHIGWNRIVRRMFEALQYEVVKLDRVVYAGLDKKNLGRGEWRFLKPEEVVRLKHLQ